MNRYIISKDAAEYLHIESTLATEKLAESIVITDEALHYNNIPLVSVVLSAEQIISLQEAGFETKPEEIQTNVVLGPDYEKVRSRYRRKMPKRLFTGKGVKIAVLDAGCNIAVVPFQVGVNFADANEGVFSPQSHGTQVSSIIKHPTMGMAPDSVFHFVKTINDNLELYESAALASLDYVADNNFDIINISWQSYLPSLKPLIDQILANGTIICAASGNSHTDSFTVLPAGYPGVIAVNAIDEAGEPFYKSYYPYDSNSHGIDVACSGVACELYNANGTYTYNYGTSYSSPFFVGLLACYKEEYPNATNAEVLEIALKRATPAPGSPQYFGRGIASF